METLLQLFEQRLRDLSETFLNLLEQIQQSKLFLEPEVSQFRFDYLADVIRKTLENDQEKIIRKLNQQLQEERIKTAKSSKSISLNTTDFSSSNSSIEPPQKSSKSQFQRRPSDICLDFTDLQNDISIIKKPCNKAKNISNHRKNSKAVGSVKLQDFSSLEQEKETIYNFKYFKVNLDI